MQTFIENTLIIIKPDGVQRTLVGEIIKRFEQIGLKIRGMKMMQAEAHQVRNHYLVDEKWLEIVGGRTLENLEKSGMDVSGKTAIECGEEVLKRLERYMTAGPVIACVLTGANAIQLVRKLVGSTEPLSSDVGTIRGDFVLDSYTMADGDERSIRNLIHASSSPEDAGKEINIWFQENELLSYTNIHERILYDVNFDNEKE